MVCRYVLGIDPGMMTGFALYDTEADVIDLSELSWQEACTYMENTCASFGADLAIAIERFTITIQTAKDSQAPWSLMQIGVAEYLGRKYNCEFTLQQVASAKRFSADWRLKALGWYVPGLSHARDAARHTLLYLVTRKWWKDCLASEDGS